MKKALVNLLPLLFSVLCGAQSQLPAEGDFVLYHDAGKTKKSAAGTFTGGKKTGNWTWWDAAGLVISQGGYTNNKREGKWIFRHGTFSVPVIYTVVSATFRNGRPDSLWTLTDSAGTLLERQRYVNRGDKTLFTSWYASGQRKREGQFIYPDTASDPAWDDQQGNSSMHGLWTAWHANGKKEWRARFVNGKAEGIKKAWHESGRRRFSGRYVNGKKEGAHKYWDKSGTLTSLTEYKSDVQHGRGVVFHGGKKHYEEIYRHGKLVKASRYKENGGVESVKNYTP